VRIGDAIKAEVEIIEKIEKINERKLVRLKTICKSKGSCYIRSRGCSQSSAVMCHFL
jgi:hypothetical protein